MKKIQITIIGLASCILISGCAGTAKVATALKGDTATVVHKINTIYGTSSFIRSAPGTNQNVTIAPDGTVTITSK